MAQVLPVSIPTTNNIETLRQRVVVALNNLSIRIAQTDQRTAPMSMGGNRLTDVPDPSNALDAVNLRTLKKFQQGNTHRVTRSGGSVYTIVWSFYGTPTGTSTSPAYIINPSRTGTPVVAKFYAVGTGTGSTTANIFYRQGGTGAPAQVLTSDINLPANAFGPVSESNFTLTANLSVNDIFYTVLTTAGGATNLTLELLIQP
jgi:hypothetical protein